MREFAGDYPYTQNVNQLQVKLLGVTAAGIFLFTILVAAVSVFPFYTTLKKEQEQRLLTALNASTFAVQEYLARIDQVAVQVTSRTKARNKLEEYNQAKISLDEFQAYSRPILTDALAINPTVLGITRLDRGDQVALTVGTLIPEGYWPVLAQVRHAPMTGGPFLIGEDYFITVAAPILDRQSQRVGTDIVLFTASPLQKILANTADSETQAIEGYALGKLKPDGALIFFLHDEAPVPVKMAGDSPIGLAIKRAVGGNRGLLPAERNGLTGNVIAYSPVNKTGWGLIAISKIEHLYATVRPQILKLATVVIGLIILGCGAILMLLRPLTGQLIIHTKDLEQEAIKRQRAMDEAVRLRNRLNQIVNASPSAIYAMDCTGDSHSPFKLTLASNTIQRLFGYPASNGFRDDNFWVKHLHPDDRPKTLARLNQICEQGELTLEYRFQHQNGSYRWIHDQVHLLRDEQGEPLELIGSWTDITAAKASEVELKSSEQKVRAILDNVLEGVIAINEIGIVEIFNPAAEKIFLWRGDEVIGRNFNVLLPSPDQDPHQPDINRFLGTGEENLLDIGGEVVGLRKDGTTFPMNLLISEMRQPAWPFKDRRASKRRTFIGTVQDLTTRRQQEEMLRRSRKMEALGQLTGGLAHDFNNILGIIMGNLEIAQCLVNESQEVRGRLDVALKTARRGADLIQRLLSFSRQETTTATATDIGPILTGMEDLLSKSLTKQIEIEIHTAKDLWAVEIDAGELEDVLVNLAFNARDAMSKGGNLTIEAHNIQLDAEYAKLNPGVVPGEYVLVSVSDSGTGIPKEIIEKVFDPFFTTKLRGKGSGLGLSMVYGFIQRAQGHIKIYSETGHGTSVRMYLPKTSPREDERSTATNGDIRLPGGTETILIVDDEEELAQVAQAHLEEYGYHTLVAYTGKQALDVLAHNENIDLLFSDVVMPGGMSGYDLAEQAIELRPPLTVLLTSGYTEKTVQRNGISRITENLLAKPYRKADLLKRIRQILDGKA